MGNSDMAQDKYKAKLSAYMDGELDPGESEGLRAALEEDQGLRKDLADFRLLAAEARELPVPRMDDDTGSALWEIIADQTVKAKQAEGARSSAVSAAKWSERAKALGQPPEVGEDRWNKAWDGVRAQTGLKGGVEEATSSVVGAVSAQPLQADFTPVDLQTVTPAGGSRAPSKVESSFPIWTAAGLMAAAAMILLAVFGGLEWRPVPEQQNNLLAEQVEFDEPEPGDKYISLVKHYSGVEEPAVCFFLKDDE